jgi:phenylpyruvate tautomerase PptA (4-oxalocrotonate tautomerase family)
MPLVTVLDLRSEDDLQAIEAAVTHAMAGMPELEINDWEIDVIPVLRPDGFGKDVTRINVELWERAGRTKEGLQELAARVAESFKSAAGQDRHVKVVIRPYDVETAGWVSV